MKRRRKPRRRLGVLLHNKVDVFKSCPYKYDLKEIFKNINDKLFGNGGLESCSEVVCLSKSLLKR